MKIWLNILLKSNPILPFIFEINTVGTYSKAINIYNNNNVYLMDNNGEICRYYSMKMPVIQNINYIKNNSNKNKIYFLSK